MMIKTVNLVAALLLCLLLSVIIYTDATTTTTTTTMINHHNKNSNSNSNSNSIHNINNYNKEEEKNKWKFTIENDLFMINNNHNNNSTDDNKENENNGMKPFKFFAGELHYFRVIPEYWEDRLDRMKAMGLNTVTTYIPWNFHEYEKGFYDFGTNGGNNDHSFNVNHEWRNLRRFFRLIQERDMYVILRPGPYICAEWEYGGLPSWLLESGKPIGIRTYAQPFIDYVGRYMTHLFQEVVKDFLYTETGGPILMVQVENEYGSFGHVKGNANDERYIRYLIDLFRSNLNEEVVLFTTDGGNLDLFERGSLPGKDVISFADGCNGAEKVALINEITEKFNPKGKSPFMCTEFYTGWLTHYDNGIANKSTTEEIMALEGVLQAKNNTGSVSLYMAHGGTNFGFTAGTNFMTKTNGYKHDITSYDYNCPIAEGGEHNVGSDGKDKFVAFSQMMMKYGATNQDVKEPAPMKKAAYGEILMTEMAFLLEDENLKVLTLEGKIHNIGIELQPGEPFGCSSGFILYNTVLRNAVYPLSNSNVTAIVHDRAQFFINDTYQGSFFIDDESSHITLKDNTGYDGDRLTILVEMMGRMNFSPGMRDARKGLIGDAISINGRPLRSIDEKGWNLQCLPMLPSMIGKLKWKPISDLNSHSKKNSLNKMKGQPIFYQGVIHIDEIADTYLVTYENWTKGVVWINGNNLGTYWIKPQGALYVPAVWLKKGENTVVILELEENLNDSLKATFVDHPIWN